MIKKRIYMSKWVHQILALLLFTAGFSQVFSQDYRPFSKEQLREFIPSNSRYVNSLLGNWERSVDGSTWKTIKLPVSEIENKSVIYKRLIKLDKYQLSTYNWFLHFLGMNEEVELYVNNSYVGRYFAGMSPISIRLPEAKLLAGMNTIQIHILPSPASASRHIFSQRSYTGIIREVLLVGTPHVWVEDVHTNTSFTQNFTSCDVKTKVIIKSGAIESLGVQNSFGGSSVSLGKLPITIETTLRKVGSNEIVSRSEDKYLDIQRDRSINLDVNLHINNPDLWSPTSPNLYRLTVKIYHNGALIDDYSVPIGLYSMQSGLVENKFMLILNNQPFKVKAVDYLEHIPGLGQTISGIDIQKDIIALKTLGINTIRVRYGMPHPYLVEQCNLNGIFILCDMPAYDLPNGIIESDEITVRMNNIGSRMLSAYDKHPCILGYGLSDGLQEGSSQTKKFHTSLCGLFRTLSNKLVYKTVRFGSRVIDEKLFDFLILRSSPRWQPGDIQANEIERLRTLAPNKPILVHFGKPVQPNNLQGYNDPLSVESQAQFIRDSYRTAQQGKTAGIVVWSFSDFITERSITITNPEDQYLCTSGLTDFQRQPRLAYTMLKALLNDEKEPLLRSGSVNQDTPMIFIVLGIVLGLILLILMTRFRRLREYIIRALIRPYNFYSDIRDQRILSIGQTMSVALLSSATLGLIMSTFLYVFRSSFGTEYLYMIFLPSGLLRSILNAITWSPSLGVFIFIIVGLLAHVFAAGIIRVAAFFSRSRVFFLDAFTISVWSALPYIIILPIGLALYKILGTGNANWLIIILSIMFIWYYYRMLRSTAVVFDVPSMPVYLVGSGMFLVLILSMVGYFSAKMNILSYIQYYFSTVS